MSRSPEAIERNRAAARAYAQRMKAADPEGVAAKKAAYYQANREKMIAASRASYRRNHLMRSYGITVEEYEARLAQQGGKCAACAASEPGGAGAFHVDHDHETGAVRGLLCTRCNQALGFARDSVEILMSLATYLLQSQDVLSLQEGQRHV